MKKVGGSFGLPEFQQYVDIAPYLNVYGVNRLYNIAFDIRSDDVSKRNLMQIYCQNGNDSKYYIGYTNVKVSEVYEHKSINVLARIQNSEDTVAMLAFYGLYGTGNSPWIKNLRFDLGEGFESGAIISSNNSTNPPINLYAKWLPTSVTLPIPTKAGYTFLGWYTEKNGGIKVDNTYTPSENITLYAHWMQN